MIAIYIALVALVMADFVFLHLISRTLNQVKSNFKFTAHAYKDSQAEIKKLREDLDALVVKKK